jgi:membrane protein GlpM
VSNTKSILTKGNVMAALFFKCLLGALAVLIIALLSKSKSFFIAGLVPLFPTFALIAHYIVGTERTMEDLRTTALFGLYSLIPYAAYLLAVYYFSYWLPLTSTLVCATLVWLAFAALLLVSWTRLNPAMA